jgi:uncharacterized protein YlxW (UPF0749 family)
MGKAKQLSMLAAALVLGVLVSVQWPTVAAQLPSPSDQISQTMRQLESEQQELKRAIGRLRQELNERQQAASASTDILHEVRTELTLQKMRAGLIDVRGPGIRILLDDGPRMTGGGERDGPLVHDYDLRDVINVLWMADAEAIAINDERIVNSTSIYCVGSTVIVNDTRLSPPYQISAIGDPVRLQDYLRNPGYLSGIRTRIERFGLSMEVVHVDSMTVPAYRGSFPQHYAQPGS